MLTSLSRAAPWHRWAGQLERTGRARWAVSPADPWQDSMDLLESPNNLHAQFCSAPTLVPCAVSSWGQLCQGTPLLCPCRCPGAHTCSDARPSTYLYNHIKNTFPGAHTCSDVHPSTYLYSHFKNTFPGAFHTCPGVPIPAQVLIPALHLPQCPHIPIPVCIPPAQTISYLARCTMPHPPSAPTAAQVPAPYSPECPCAYLGTSIPYLLRGTHTWPGTPNIPPARVSPYLPRCPHTPPARVPPASHPPAAPPSSSRRRGSPAG